ncbi:MAG: hypothetical protein ACK4K4_04905, partial [Caldimicrobium sp.]
HAEWQIDISLWQQDLCSRPNTYDRKLCSSPSKIGSFATKEECEKARYEMCFGEGRNDRFLFNRSYCTGFDSPGRKKYSNYSGYGPTLDEKIKAYASELRKMGCSDYVLSFEHSAKNSPESIDMYYKIHLDLCQQDLKREALAKQTEEEKAKIFKMRKESMLRNIKSFSTDPVKKYNTALRQSCSMAYMSIKAAELALKGDFKNFNILIADLEKARQLAGQGFDTPNTYSDYCPYTNFKPPGVSFVIEDDPTYKFFNEIFSKSYDLIKTININKEKLNEIKEKKNEVYLILQNKESKLKELEEAKKTTKNNKEQNKLNSLLEQAKQAYEEANRDYQKVKEAEEELLKKEESFRIELVELKNRLEQMKNKEVIR